ncbi:MAG: hypothetical protein KAH01_04795 [Caldisericia bacterium]|nr:hypothetical protein [Caldisericia bacterium]
MTEPIYLRILDNTNYYNLIKTFPNLKIMMSGYLSENDSKPKYLFPTLVWTDADGNWTHQPLWDRNGEYILSEYDVVADKSITIDEYMNIQKTMIKLTQREIYDKLYKMSLIFPPIDSDSPIREANIYASKNTVKEWRKQYGSKN